MTSRCGSSIGRCPTPDREVPGPRRGLRGLAAPIFSCNTGGFVGSPLPIVPGHEAAGIVDAVGPEVRCFAVGDQVAMYYIDAPPDSRYARSGHLNIGPGVRRMGVDVDGAFAEYVVRPAAYAAQAHRTGRPGRAGRAY